MVPSTAKTIASVATASGAIWSLRGISSTTDQGVPAGSAVTRCASARGGGPWRATRRPVLSCKASDQPAGVGTVASTRS
ncbi:MAG: hypothetical protein U1F50_05885 [Rubrivivax sp.]